MKRGKEITLIGRDDPGLRSVRSFIVYSEIFNQSPTPRFVELLFGRMHQPQVMSLVSSLSMLLHNDQLNALSSEQQRQLTRPHEHEHRWIARLGALISSDRVLVHEVQLGLMARLAIQYSSDGPTQSDFTDVFFRALLAVNELHGDTQHIDGAERTPTAFLQVELQSELLPNERPAHVMHRYNEFVKWCRARDTNDPDYFDIDADFLRLVGISFEDYATASYCFFSKFLTMKSAKEIENAGGPFVSLSNMKESFRDSSALQSWFDRFSVGIDGMRDQLGNAPTTYRSADLVPFQKRPLLLAEGDAVICPVPSFLLNTAGTGLYFTLFDAYKQADGDAAAFRFARSFGSFLEDYCYDLLVYGTRQTAAKSSREIAYDSPNGQRKSTDVVIRDDSHVSAFIEISKKRFNLLKTIVNEDAVGLEADLDEMIVEKAGQIDRSYRDLAAGCYNYPFEIESMMPIVVTGQDVPGMLAINKIIRDRLLERKIFDGLPSTELVYLSVDELETLVVAYPGNLNLVELFSEKLAHASPTARAGSVRNFLYYFKHNYVVKGEERDTVLPGYERYFRDVIMKTLDRWGMPIDWQQLDRFLAEHG